VNGTHAKYFDNRGIGVGEQLVFFWGNVARYGRVDVMEWAIEQGYSSFWNQRRNYYEYFGANICAKSAE
jgi:hypothetical protein